MYDNSLADVQIKESAVGGSPLSKVYFCFFVFTSVVILVHNPSTLQERFASDLQDSLRMSHNVLYNNSSFYTSYPTFHPITNDYLSTYSFATVS